MATTIKTIEAIPAAYPNVSQYAHWSGPEWETDTGDTNEVNSDMLWQRIEAYIAYRWTSRGVVWIVEGPGEWTPPLTPATITATERWTGAAWETVTLDASPLGGLMLPGAGPYRITATVGANAGAVPEAVQEAFRRLYEYSKGIANQFRGDAGRAGGEGGEIYGWAAKSIQLSGAGDLLRPYRRA